MSHRLFADVICSVSEFKTNPSQVMQSAAGAPVAILNHNKPEWYCVPAEFYEKLMTSLDDALDDVELCSIAEERKDQELVDVDLSKYL